MSRDRIVGLAWGHGSRKGVRNTACPDGYGCVTAMADKTSLYRLRIMYCDRGIIYKTKPSTCVVPCGNKMASTGIDLILLACHYTATRTLIQNA